MKTMIIALACFAATTFSAAADEYTLDDLASDLDALMSNGSWECNCRCEVSSQFGQRARIPGKCDADTEGSTCTFMFKGHEQYGELKLCKNIFVIADED